MKFKKIVGFGDSWMWGDELFDPNLTEWENMRTNKWDRIWDCGSLKFELFIK